MPHVGLFEEKDTVSVHRGLAVLLLSNAYTSGCRDRALLAEVAESAGDLRAVRTIAVRT
jgi:hypothetical protein